MLKFLFYALMILGVSIFAGGVGIASLTEVPQKIFSKLLKGKSLEQVAASHTGRPKIDLERIERDNRLRRTQTRAAQNYRNWTINQSLKQQRFQKNDTKEWMDRHRRDLDRQRLQQKQRMQDLRRRYRDSMNSRRFN